MPNNALEALCCARAQHASDAVFKLDSVLDTFSVQIRVNGDLRDAAHGNSTEGLDFCIAIGLPSDILDLHGPQQFVVLADHLPPGLAGLKIATHPLIAGKGIHGVMRLVYDVSSAVELHSFGYTPAQVVEMMDRVANKA